MIQAASQAWKQFTAAEHIVKLESVDFPAVLQRVEALALFRRSEVGWKLFHWYVVKDAERK